MRLYIITIGKVGKPLMRFSLEAMSIDEASDKVACMEASEGCEWYKVEEQ